MGKKKSTDVNWQCLFGFGISSAYDVSMFRASAFTQSITITQPIGITQSITITITTPSRRSLETQNAE